MDGLYYIVCRVLNKEFRMKKYSKEENIGI